MKLTLKDLTRDDWNRLFPIELVDHNPEWKYIFQKEKQLILSSGASGKIKRIEHFGSSSIPSIKSKPYIDILIEVSSELLFDKEIINDFEAIGYTYFEVPQREDIDAYMSFGKGYNLDGRKDQIFHIHMCPKENFMWSQIEFRDQLNANEPKAKEYETLKSDLMAKLRNDRGAYVLGKSDFIRETLKLIRDN